jgi:T5SS/PEP-CTERM-associated repeat protein
LLGEAKGSQAIIAFDDADLTINGLLPAANRELVIAGGGEAMLNLTEGHIESYGATIIGRDLGSQGTFTVSSTYASYAGLGSGTTVGEGGFGSWTLSDSTRADVAGDLNVGALPNSQGHILVEDHARLTAPGYGNYQMTSVAIGAAGSGTLEITSGGLANLDGPLVIGRDQGSQGMMTIKDAHSELNPQASGSAIRLALTVGDAGQGAFTVQQGGRALLGDTITVGKTATGNGHITIDGSGSQLQSAGYGNERIDQLIIGENGVGKFTVGRSGNANLIDADVVIAQNAGSQGLLEVNGSGSNFIAKDLSIGLGGTGQVSITSGGTVGVWTSSVENYAGGTIFLDNGILNQYLSSAGVQIQNQGKILDNGTIAGDVHNLPGGVVSGAGFITGTLSAEGGMIAPGNSPGTLYAGALDLNAGTLQVEMNDADGTAGEIVGWDLLVSESTAVLTGPITIDLVSLALANVPGNVADFDPMRDYSWTILTASQGITGFSLNEISVDTSAFSNPFLGRFFVTEVGNTLELNYAVPEPGTLTIAVIGAIGLMVFYRKRRS